MPKTPCSAIKWDLRYLFRLPYRSLCNCGPVQCPNSFVKSRELEPIVNRLNKSNKINYYEKRLNNGNTDNDCNSSNGNNDTDCSNSDGKVNGDDSNYTDKHDSNSYTDKKMWSNVKQLTNKLKQIPP